MVSAIQNLSVACYDKLVVMCQLVCCLIRALKPQLGGWSTRANIFRSVTSRDGVSRCAEKVWRMPPFLYPTRRVSMGDEKEWIVGEQATVSKRTDVANARFIDVGSSRFSKQEYHKKSLISWIVASETILWPKGQNLTPSTASSVSRFLLCNGVAIGRRLQKWSSFSPCIFSSFSVSVSRTITTPKDWKWQGKAKWTYRLLFPDQNKGTNHSCIHSEFISSIRWETHVSPSIGWLLRSTSLHPETQWVLNHVGYGWAGKTTMCSDFICHYSLRRSVSLFCVTKSAKTSYRTAPYVY